MSGVLARMIRRSRESLPVLEPVLEPVIRPRFAAPADGFAPGDDLAPGPPSPGELPPGAWNPEALDPGGSGADTSGLPGTVRPALTTARDSSDRAPADAAQPPVRHAMPGGGGGGDGGGGGGLGPDIEECTEEFAAESAHGNGLVADEGSARPNPDPPPRLAPEGTGWPVAPHAGEGGYRSQRRDGRSAASVAADPVSQTGPSVTITIGHIEVRAAPDPQRPTRQEAAQRPRPVFRPQLTLADFLTGGAGRPRGDGRR